MCEKQKGHWMKNGQSDVVVWSRKTQLCQATKAGRETCIKNGIDLSNLEELLPETTDPYQVMENYMQLGRKYPFADFDNAYFALNRECPLEGILGAYIRENMTLFFGN